MSVSAQDHLESTPQIPRTPAKAKGELGWQTLRRKRHLIVKPQEATFSKYSELNSQTKVSFVEGAPTVDGASEYLVSGGNESQATSAIKPKNTALPKVGKLALMNETNGNHQVRTGRGRINVTELMPESYQAEIAHALTAIKGGKNAVEQKPIHVSDKLLVLPAIQSSKTIGQKRGFCIKTLKMTKIPSQRSVKTQPQKPLYQATSDASKLELAMFQKGFEDERTIAEYLKNPFDLDGKVPYRKSSEQSISILEEDRQEPVTPLQESSTRNLKASMKSILKGKKQPPFSVLRLAHSNTDVTIRSGKSSTTVKPTSTRTSDKLRGPSFLANGRSPSWLVEDSVMTIGSRSLREVAQPKLQHLIQRCIAEAHYYPRVGQKTTAGHSQGSDPVKWLTKSVADGISSSVQYLQARRERGIIFDIVAE